MIKLQLLWNGSDITKRTGNFVRSDSVDGLAMSFSFSMAYNADDLYLPDLNILPGDKVIFINKGKTVFTGIIVDEFSGQYEKNYTAYDYGWYLNKNEVVVQFRDMTAQDAITKLCDDFSIPVGTIASMPTKISKIYNGDILSDCIRDIISQVEQEQAKSFRMEIRDGKFYIEPYADLIITASFQSASNIAAFDPTKAPANEQISRSIAEMCNTIKVVSAEEESVQIIAEALDETSIARFGKLQKVERLNELSSAQVNNVAKNLLLEHNRITEVKTVTFLGDDAVRSGRILNVQGNMYLVKSCSHSYTGASHTMDLELEAVN